MARRLTTEDLVLNIIVNSNKAQSEIGRLSRAMVDAKSKLSAAEAEMRRLERAGQTNSNRYRQLQTDVQNYNSVISDSRRRLADLNQTLSLQDKSLKQLEQSLRRTRQLWRQATNDTDRQRYANEMEMLNRRIRELRAGSEQTGNALLRMSSKIQQYFAVITAGIASFMAAFSGVKKATDEYARFDDILADVMKTTNLSKDAVKELNAELEKFDTRTSQEDLLGLGRIAGKLGYSEISDITEFVRANNQIIVALNEDLGGNVEETVNKIGKLVEIFKLRDLYDTEEAFLKVGSAINELGMASTANEGYMVEFARRMAGVAPLAGVTIEQILGLGSALDQLGQTEEVASTALSKLFLSIAKDAKTYSKYAGMEVKAFTELLEKDFMGAFTRVLQGVKNNSEGINALAATLGDLGQDGGRVIGVIGSLANNVDILTDSIALSNKAMADGTSITDEYNIKNETAAAKLDRTRKEVSKFWRELGEKLWPTISEGNNLLVTFLKLMIQLIGFISNNIKWISVLTVSVIAYYTAVQIAAKWEAITTAYMATKRVVAIALAGVYALLTGNLARATAAQRLLNITMTANPYGIVAALIVGLTALIYKLSSSLTVAEKAQKTLNDTNAEANNAVASQRFEIERLTKVIKDETKERSLRLTAIKRLREIMPNVLKDYSDEALMAGKATQAIENQTAALLYQAKIKAKQSALNKIVEDNEKYNRRDEGGFWKTVGDIAFGEANNEYFRGRSRQQYEDRLSLQNLALKDLQKTEEDYLKFQEKVKTKIEEPGNVSPISITDPKAARAAEKARKDAYSKELEDQEKHFQELLQKHDLFRVNVSEMTEEQLNKLLELEADNQEKVDAIHTKYGETLKTTSQRAKEELDRRKKQADTYIATLIRQQKSETELENIAYQERLKKAGLFGIDRQKMTEQQLQALEILEKQHADNLAKIDADAIKTEYDRLQRAYDTKLADMRIRHNDELASITTLDQAKQKLGSVMSERELKQVKTLGQARKLIENQQRLEQEAATRQHLQELLLIVQKAMDTGQWEGLNLSDKIMSEEGKEKLKGYILEIKELLSKLNGLDKSDEITEGENDKMDVLGMTVKDWQDLFDNIENGKLKLKDLFGVLNAGTELWGQYNKIVANKEDQQIKIDEAANEKKKENLKKRLDAGAISQESYNKQVEKLDKSLDKKKAEIARAQAKRERNVALMSAIVNTAAGVAKVLASPGGVAGMILAALVGAMGGLQIATIASTPLPTVEGRESGGYLKVERAQDGKVFNAKVDPDRRGYVQEPTVIVGENGSEWVANAQAVDNPTVRPILDVLDTAQKNGTISTLNLQEVIAGTLGRRKAQGREVGGYVNRESQSAPADYSAITDVLVRLDATVQKLDVRLANLKAEVSLLGRNGFVEKMQELEDIQNNANL